MNHKIYMLLVLALLHITCNKTEDDFSGKEVLRGKLSYINGYAGDGLAKVLPHKKVKLAYAPSDTLNFLYSDSTDADGYFLFENLVSGRSYSLFFRDSIEGSSYIAFYTVTAPETKVNLVATNDAEKQNGLYLETKLGGQPAGDVRICIFNNQAYFQADTCNGSYRSDFSDNSGRKAFFNMQAANYFIRAYKRIGNDIYTDTTSTVVSTGMRPVTLQLAKVKSINALDIQVTDLFGSPVTAARVGLYTSRIVFLADTLGTNTFRSGSTAATGTASFPDIVAGRYYVRTLIQIGSSTLSGSDSVLVNPTGTASKTIVIK